MTNCPYCGGEIPSKDFALRTPEGNYWHFPCADKALDEWAALREENEKLLAVVEAARAYACEEGCPDGFINSCRYSVEECGSHNCPQRGFWQALADSEGGHQ